MDKGKGNGANIKWNFQVSLDKFSKIFYRIKQIIMVLLEFLWNFAIVNDVKQ